MFELQGAQPAHLWHLVRLDKRHPQPQPKDSRHPARLSESSLQALLHEGGFEEKSEEKDGRSVESQQIEDFPILE
jgi:hypothetical protein